MTNWTPERIGALARKLGAGPKEKPEWWERRILCPACKQTVHTTPCEPSASVARCNACGHVEPDAPDSNWKLVHCYTGPTDPAKFWAEAEPLVQGHFLANHSLYNRFDDALRSMWRHERSSELIARRYKDWIVGMSTPEQRLKALERAMREGKKDHPQDHAGWHPDDEGHG